MQLYIPSRVSPKRLQTHKKVNIFRKYYMDWRQQQQNNALRNRTYTEINTTKRKREEKIERSEMTKKHENFLKVHSPFD